MHNLDNSVSLHQRYLGFLVTEIFKRIPKTNPKFMWSYFSSKNLSYNLRKGPPLSLPSAKSTVHGTNSVDFKGRLIWNNLPYLVTSSASVFEFTGNLKKFEVLTVHILFAKINFVQYIILLS